MNAALPHHLALIVAVAANAGSNLLLKAAMTEVRARGEAPLLASVLGNGRLYAGLAAAGVLLLCYLFALQRVPLKLAYAAVTTGSLALIVVGSIVFFGSAPSPRLLLGVAFAATAVWLLS